MKFDYCIGNPPYQSNTLGDNDKFAPSVFNDFMDAAYQISDKVEMITPAKFLFNAGNTPKKWNDERLHDKHFKVEKYYADSRDVFSGVNIAGGVVIHYRDAQKDYGEIGVFINDDIMASIQNKVVNTDFVSMQQIVITRTAYRLTDRFHEDYPNAVNDLSNGHKYDMSTNIFDRIPYAFVDTLPSEIDATQYYKILGRTNNERAYKFIKKEYVRSTVNTNKYKVVIPKAWDCAMMPIIEAPNVATTETFITVGMFDLKSDVDNCLKYIRTKFARSLLMVLKTTQDLSPEKWAYVPLQDFTSNSDIDWSQSISNIDKQLYKKYGLTDQEIEFIETHVKPME